VTLFDEYLLRFAVEKGIASPIAPGSTISCPFNGGITLFAARNRIKVDIPILKLGEWHRSTVIVVISVRSIADLESPVRASRYNGIRVTPLKDPRGGGWNSVIVRGAVCRINQ
jgi:hypothetical protein